jgi:hypothetical protein
MLRRPIEAVVIYNGQKILQLASIHSSSSTSSLLSFQRSEKRNKAHALKR